MMRTLPILLFLGGTSCAVIPAPPPPGRPPLAWRLVEHPAPAGDELVLEAYDPSALMRIEIRFSQEHAGVGEVVEAEVRLPDATGLHRVEIVPDRPGVEVIGPRETWIDGPRPSRVRFTCVSPGRAGIRVLVKE